MFDITEIKKLFYRFSSSRTRQPHSVSLPHQRRHRRRGRSTARVDVSYPVAVAVAQARPLRRPAATAGDDVFARVHRARRESVTVRAARDVRTPEHCDARHSGTVVCFVRDHTLREQFVLRNGLGQDFVKRLVGHPGNSGVTVDLVNSSPMCEYALYGVRVARVAERPSFCRTIAPPTGMMRLIVFHVLRVFARDLKTAI